MCTTAFASVAHALCLGKRNAKRLQGPVPSWPNAKLASWPQRPQGLYTRGSHVSTVTSRGLDMIDVDTVLYIAIRHFFMGHDLSNHNML